MSRIDRLVRRLCAVGAVFALGLAAPQAAPIAIDCADIRDDFDGAALDLKTWHVIQLYNSQFEMQHRVAASGRAARLFVQPGDRACGGSCQRNEIRVANGKRCSFGEEVWYRFKFRIDGRTPEKGSVRWVIGQWKQESGGSPFLAQRFDNGVFHITVQHNASRILVAKAAGNPNARETGPDQVGFLAHTSRIRRAVWGGIESEPTSPEIDRGPHQVLRFAAPPQPGAAPTDVTVELGPDPVLPDPGHGWVDMVYRVRGGRDGTGLIEIWADGVFKARVTGTIGNDDIAGPTQYFKFGHYRDIHATFGEAQFYFDDFRRARTRAGVMD